MAGFFMLFAFAGVVAFIVGAAIQNNWLEPRISYHTHVVRGDGLRKGSPILLSGIEVGEVGDVTILEDNRIDVELLVRERHQHRIRGGTTAEIRRLLGIGEKRIHLASGVETQGALPANALLPANEPMDILDAVSDLDLSKYMSTMDRAVAAMEVTLNKLEENNRLERIMEAFDQMGPTMEQMNSLLAEISGPMADLLKDPSFKRTFVGADKLFNDRNTRKAMNAMATTFEPEKMGALIDRMDKAFTRFDELLIEGGDLQGTFAGTNRLMNDGRLDRLLVSMEKMTDVEKFEKLLNNLSIVAEEMATMGPEIPVLSGEMIVTLREMVIVLKALQKHWLLDDEVEEVKEESRSRKKR
jgi:MlaD protein